MKKEKKMKKLIPIFFVVAVLLFGFSYDILAQNADTLDVPQGFETLNLAIEGDTTATGEAKNLNRVYRLQRGGYYLLNGSITNIKGAPLRIVAAKGDGPMPILIPAVTESGRASRAFKPTGDGTFVGLYVSGIDNLGNEAEKNMFRFEKTGARYIIDNCFLDSDHQSFCRMNSENQKLYVTNTTMRNAFSITSPGNGRFIDTRGNTTDSIFVQNSTLYVNTQDPLKSSGGIIKNIFIDHVTFYETGGYPHELHIERAINCTFTNNLLIDFGFEGAKKPVSPPVVERDSVLLAIVNIDTLNAPDLATEGQRHYLIKNNVYGFTPELLTWINSVDTVVTYVFENVRTKRFIANYPNMISENNIEEYPVFSDPPDPAKIVAWSDHRRKTNFSNENNPDIRADRNGRGAFSTNPNSFGPAPDEYDFDYSTQSQSYTHAEGGFPVGDLNWFPDKKAEWEIWVSTAVKNKRSSTVPIEFTLKQNYPNPFNPSTTIAYELNSASTVKLTIYNSLGEKVRTLLNAKHKQPGSYSVKWDGLDDANQPVASGIYIYKLQSGNRVQSRKMLLMK